MCSFIAFMFRTECQASRISLCRHADDLSTISTRSSNIFGDCGACGVWPTKSFHQMLLWPLRALSRVILARAMSDQRKHNQSLHFILYTIPLEASFSILSFGFLSMFEIVRIGL